MRFFKCPTQVYHAHTTTTIEFKCKFAIEIAHTNDDNLQLRATNYEIPASSPPLLLLVKLKLKISIDEVVVQEKEGACNKKSIAMIREWKFFSSSAPVNIQYCETGRAESWREELQKIQ